MANSSFVFIISTKLSQSDGDENRMNTGTHELSENRNWRELYKATIRELDSDKLPDRIAEAKRVLVQRARELFQKTGDNLEEEQAVDAAMCTLHVLHSTLKAPPITAQENAQLRPPEGGVNHAVAIVGNREHWLNRQVL